MQANYQDAVAAILFHLKQQGSSLSKIHSHESCYHMLQRYLELKVLCQMLGYTKKKQNKQI